MHGPNSHWAPKRFPISNILNIYMGKGPQARLLVIEHKIAGGAPVCAITTCNSEPTVPLSH